MLLFNDSPVLLQKVQALPSEYKTWPLVQERQVVGVEQLTQPVESEVIKLHGVQVIEVEFAITELSVGQLFTQVFAAVM